MYKHIGASTKAVEENKLYLAHITAQTNKKKRGQLNASSKYIRQNCSLRTHQYDKLNISRKISSAFLFAMSHGVSNNNKRMTGYFFLVPGQNICNMFQIGPEVEWMVAGVENWYCKAWVNL